MFRGNNVFAQTISRSAATQALGGLLAGIALPCSVLSFSSVQ